MMVERAVSPSAMALSTQWSPWPSLSNALANSATARDSPFDVHQWMTSRSVAEAIDGAARAMATMLAPNSFCVN